MKKSKGQAHYIEALLAELARTPTGSGVHMMSIAHDDWCRIWQGGACNCAPEVKRRESNAPER